MNFKIYGLDMNKKQIKDTTGDLFKEPPKDLKTRQREYKERQKANKTVRLDVLLPEGVGDMLEALVGLDDKKSKKAVVAHLIKKEYARLYALKNSKLKKYVDSKKGGTDKSEA